ncbi:S1 family peptidase [Bradyrhizobium liaoningense]
MSDNWTGFKHTGFDSPVTEIAILLVGTKDRHASLGTGVIIGPHIAITARHVVDEYLKQFEGREIAYEKSFGTTFSLMAIQFLDNGAQGSAWDVRQVYLSKDNDIAFLFLMHGTMTKPGYIWKKLKLQLLAPPVGTRIAAFGYHSSSVEEDQDSVVLTTNPYSSYGLVEEIHLLERDSGFLNFPCFRTNARFDPAMSGGPVLTEEGVLCGIVCSSLPPEDGDDASGHTSYVSALWPSMTTFVGFPIEHQPAENYFAMELISRGYLDAIDRDRVEIARTSNPSQVQILLRNPPR